MNKETGKQRVAVHWCECDTNIHKQQDSFLLFLAILPFILVFQTFFQQVGSIQHQTNILCELCRAFDPKLSILKFGFRAFGPMPI